MSDPIRDGHPLRAAQQLARLLREEDGFDRSRIAVALLIAAQEVAAEDGNTLAFAIHMQNEAIRDAALIGAAMASTATMMRN